MSKPVTSHEEIAPSGVSLDFLMRAIGSELSDLDRGRLSAAECRDRVAVLVRAGKALMDHDRVPGRSRMRISTDSASARTQANATAPPTPSRQVANAMRRSTEIESAQG
ncbi:MAG: hypothetical protein ACXU82_07330 [Caulobacteraceae bacterium]